jgi:hypothetical protein
MGTENEKYKKRKIFSNNTKTSQKREKSLPVYRTMGAQGSTKAMLPKSTGNSRSMRFGEIMEELERFSL